MFLLRASALTPRSPEIGHYVDAEKPCIADSVSGPVDLFFAAMQTPDCRKQRRMKRIGISDFTNCATAERAVINQGSTCELMWLMCERVRSEAGLGKGHAMHIEHSQVD